MQLGSLDTDLVLFFLTGHAESRLLSSQITLGVDAAAAAGPVGRSIGTQTDNELRTEVLSWSRSSGLFACFAARRLSSRRQGHVARAVRAGNHEPDGVSQ